MNKKNKKTAFMVGAGIVLAYVAAPGFMAGSVETMVKDSLTADLGKKIPGLVLLEYDRGWFKSTATVGIKIPEARPEDFHKLGLKLFCGTDEVVLCFDVDVKHGPIVTSFGKPTLAVGQVQASWSVPFIPNAGKEAEVLSKILNPWALSATITAHFDDTIDYEVSTSGVDIDMEEGGAHIKVDAEPIQLKGSYSVNDATVFSNFDMPKLHVEIEEDGKEHVNVKIDGIHASGEGTLIGHAFAYGTTSLKVANIQIVAKDGDDNPIVNMQNFDIQSVVSPEGDSISNLITMGLENLHVEEQYGNGEKVDISALNLEANLHGIDRITYEDLLTLANQITPGKVMREQMVQVSDHFHELVEKGLNFDVDTFSVNIGEGKVSYNHTLNFPAGVDWDSHDAFEENAKLNGTFTFDQALVDFIEAHDRKGSDARDADMDLAKALEEGLLVKDGDTYTAKFSLEGGVGTVNGKNIDELKDKLKIRIKGKKDSEKEMD